MKNSSLSIKQYLVSLFKERINLFVLAFCGAYATFWMAVLTRQYYYFRSSGDWDTATFNQTMNSLMHGSFFNTIFGVHFLADHCHFLMFLLAPFYWLWHSPLFFIYLKTGLFFIGAYLFFLLLKNKLHPWIAFGAMVAFTLSPGNISMLRSCMSFDPIAIPLFFLIFKAFEDKNYPVYIISCLLLALSKEQFPLVVMMFGVYALIFRKEEWVKWALIPFLIGLNIFIFDNFFLTSYLRRDLPTAQSYHWDEYKKFGKTPKEIFLFILTHPFNVLQQFVTDENIKWYNDLFGVWGGLAFLSPHILLPALFMFPKLLLSSFKYEHTVTTLYYASPFTPFIFLAAWNTLHYIQHKGRIWIHGLAIVIMLIHAGTYFHKYDFIWKESKIGAKEIAMHRLTNKIPLSASVVTHFNIYNLNQIYWMNSNYFKGTYSSKRKIDPTVNPDYLFVDLNKLFKDKISMAKVNFEDHWKLEGVLEDYVLYSRNDSKEKYEQLIEKSNEAFVEPVALTTVLEDCISLESVEFPREFLKEHRIFPVIFYWKSLKESKIDYEVSLRVKSKEINSKIDYKKNKVIGSSIYPTSVWHKGEYLKEKYFYLLPELEKGEYSLEIKLFSPKDKGKEKKFNEKLIIR